MQNQNEDSGKSSEILEHYMGEPIYNYPKGRLAIIGKYENEFYKPSECITAQKVTIYLDKKKVFYESQSKALFNKDRYTLLRTLKKMLHERIIGCRVKFVSNPKFYKNQYCVLYFLRYDAEGKRINRTWYWFPEKTNPCGGVS